MLNLSNNGAKVLHNKSVEIAKKFNVKIHVRSIYNENSNGEIHDVGQKEPNILNLPPKDTT